VGATVRRNVPGVVAGLCLGLLALGPGLRRGFLLSYDMVFVPREPFAAALPGLAPARAVPSGLLVAAASRVVPADVVQKLVLLAIFVLGCAGVAALLDREPLLARLAGGAFYAWNPYVAERLIIGQWALLLGYAGLPWALRAVLHAGQARWRWAGRLCLSLVPAVIGGFAAMAITALVVVPAALLTLSARRVAIVLAALAAGSLPWLIPSLQHAVYADPAGVAAFAARADTPFGTIGSLLMLGGAWNAQTVPKAYGGAWSALWLVIVIAALAGALRARAGGPAEDSPAHHRWPGLGVAAAAGLVIACIGVTSAGRDLLRAVTAAFPGAALLRDGQQFVAPLALLEATGFGIAVAWAMNPGSFGLRWPLTGTDAVSDRLRVPWCEQRREDRRNGPRGLGRPTGAGVTGAVIGTFALLAPVLLLPGLAWGAAGRLRPAWYPAGWLAAARIIDASPARGDVLLLPWQTYRTPSWNHGEVMFDPWSLLLSRPVIWNDGTRVGDVELAPDDPRARRLDGVIGGAGPLTASLSAAGVRFVLDDQDEPGQVGARLPGAVILVRQPGLTVYRLPA
jgi:hypothetical protein